MKTRDLKILLDTKRDLLVSIVSRKRRSKTEEERQRYGERLEKAKKYLNELEVIYTYMERVNYEGRMVSDNYIEIISKHRKLKTILDGEYMKLYKREDTNEYFLIASSVTKIEHFK